MLDKEEDIIDIGPQSDIEINQDNNMEKAIKEDNIDASIKVKPRNIPYNLPTNIP